jgi:inorganic pyrophosphatase
VIEAKQRKKGEDWIRNDRLLAVATHARTHEHLQDLDALRPHLLDEIEAFFRNYNDLNGREFQPLDRGGPTRARKLVDEGAEAFQRKRNGDSVGSTG